MDSSAERAVAVVAVGAILPDAPNAPAFWNNIRNKRYSITEVPPERWSIADYYDPDPSVPDKTYSKIGGWVRGFQFDWKSYRIPPRVAEAMDQAQQWAVTIAGEALADYGYPNRPLDTERTAVILGTAMGGELHYITHQRVAFPDFAHALEAVNEFGKLPKDMQQAILLNWQEEVGRRLPSITEDTMPGELANIISGRVANVFNLRGASFITDAACASTLAAIEASVDLLIDGKCDVVVTGGVDRNMGASSFVKFCKIGALSATGTRPFGDGADGFVMGEGSAAFLLKRLVDAERDGDKIYAVIRGVGGASDGKGKGITAPNPIGQQLATQRAWDVAGLDPATATLVEAHGTSTKVGDVVEVESLAKIFGTAPRGSIGLGSAKSNIGHLKAGAGAAGMLKSVMAIHHKTLPPTLNAERPNPNIDFSATPFYLNTEAREWAQPKNAPRRMGVSAYGFGGTNFHVVLEEHVPGSLTQAAKTFAAAHVPPAVTARELVERPTPHVTVPTASASSNGGATPTAKMPLRGILAIGAKTPTDLKDKLDNVWRRVEGGWTPPVAPPDPAEVSAPERLVIDFGDHDELLDRIQKARKAAGFDNPAAWKALQAQGVFRGSGPKHGKLAFLFPGQGSQYANMGRALAEREPVVKAIFDEADKVMTPILGRPLTSYIFIDATDKAAVQQAEIDLMQTAITQPAMLTMDAAVAALLAEYGFKPDIVMGHSLGEYAALTAASIMPFADALEASAARGAEMTKVSMGDNGWMAAVMAPIDVIEATLKGIDGYAVAANINSKNQAVVGGESKAVEQAIEIFQKQGYQAVRLPVSHAFHTRIVAPASKPLRQVLDRLSISEPQMRLVANVTGDLYPTTIEGIKDILELQIAAPVQWVKGLETLYREGVRTFVEVGPKKALKGFVDDVLSDKPDVVSLFTNHPKTGEIQTFNHALCGLYAAGYAMQTPPPAAQRPMTKVAAAPAPAPVATPAPAATTPAPNGGQMLGLAPQTAAGQAPAPLDGQAADALARLLAQALQGATGAQAASASALQSYDLLAPPAGSVVISGTGLGLPGAEKPVMDPDNALRILQGEQFIDLIPERFRKLMLNKRVTRLMKSEDGSGSFVTITNPDEVIKLAGRPGPFDPTEEYGIPAKLVEALDTTTQLAMAAGIDALREAGIPLVQTYRQTSKGTYLPERWILPEGIRDDTGIIFASAFPGGDRFAEDISNYYAWQNRLDQLAALEDLRLYTQDPDTLREIERRTGELREALEREPYEFDRRFIFRILAMGHSQFAEFIGARGPNTHVNAACASTAQGIALAEDWIRAGRCRRVVVIAADNVTGDHLMEWVGAGFLATGAAATDDRVEEAALPFDRRRHGTILGMGACALVVESEDSVRERGMRGIVELLSSMTENSAYHGTRLDVNHIGGVMDRLVLTAERRFGLDRRAMAPQTVFMSHETYTPARGGSASAEIVALRYTFGDAANQVIMANTKGFTGHPMGVGVEDVIAVKILEYGIVPPVPNFKEVDPDLGPLTLSRGGRYPVVYALHLAAGFGSQISMTLTRRIPGAMDRIDNKPLYQRWLDDLSGYNFAETEIVQRTLRIKAQGAPQRSPAPNLWQYGTGPRVRTAVAADVAATAHPAPMRMPEPKATTAAPAPQAPASVVGRPSSVVSQPAPQAAPVAPPPAAAAPTPVAPAPAPAPVAPAPAPAPAAPAVDPVTAKVLAVVAEKTGYPADMLDPELDLEADLGIDTVKQAETFAAIREAFDIPRRDDIKLRDFPTVASVIQFVYTNRPDLAARPTTKDEGPKVAPAVPAAAQVAAPVAAPAAAPALDAVQDTVLSVVAEKTGYPKDMLDLELDLEADLGIDTVKQAETFAAIREAFDIPRRDDIKLRDYPTLGSVVRFVYESRPDLAKPTADHRPPTTTAPAPASALPPSAGGPRGVEAPAPALDAVQDTVLSVVAEKTGYPKDMLDLELDLEADLGIDTVKQAETFAAIREAFDIPRRDDIKLRDYPTLGSVVRFVYESRPDLAQPTTDHRPLTTAAPAPAVAAPVAAPAPTSVVSAPAPAPAPAAAPAGDPVAAKVLEVIAEKTGYPPEMLDLDSDLEADLGIDTVKQAETFAAVREAFDIPRRDDVKLRDYPTLASVIKFVYDSRPDLAQPTSDHRPSTTVAPAPEAPAPATADGDPVAAKVLEVIADKTGYPPEMLDLDSDLEADLGIDTVKQAETFAAVREAFDIPRRDDVKLRDYPTLASVIKFVYDSRPDLAQPTTDHRPPTTAAPVPAAPTSVVGRSLPLPPSVGSEAPAVTSIGTLEDADKMPRRVPVPSLRPALDLCQPTGVTLDENSRVVVMLDQGGVGKALVNRLQKRNVTTLVIDEPLSAEALDTRLKAWLSEGAIQGVYWLTALDVEPAIEDMDLAGWREANRVRVKNLYTAMRALYDSVHGPNTFLVSATRLGGLHGYGETGASAPLGGAVSGFSKAYRMEKMLGEGGKGTIVKVVDFETGRKTAEPADLLIAETLTDPGIVEVGYANGQRYTVTLVEKPARDGQPGMNLTKDTVFVVTGAAGGITSAIVTDLALASKGVFYLLDLVAAPAHDDENVRLFRTDKEALKRKLIDEAKGRGERPTPAMIDKQIMSIERNEAALRAVEAVEAAGGTAHYFSLDLRDGEAVNKVVDDIRARYGRIDVLLHAGGLLIDRTLPNKEPQQFDLVFDVKADGFFSLIKAARGLPIGATVSFSSVAGRFGNNGQTDYSSANDLLCKITSSMRGWRPDTRGIAIDWTAWGQIGMASRGSVPAIMEALGVDMLPAVSGVPTIRRELTYGGTRGEIVVAGRLGAWLEENAPAGGLDVDKAAKALAATQPPLLMIGDVTAAKLYGGLTAETTLDPKAQPFLYDHQIDGVPVLPGVMGTESFAELASAAAPGYRVASIENISLSSPFKFHRHQPRTLYLSAVTAPKGGELVARTTLSSVTQPKPELPPQVREHFTADVRLTQGEGDKPTATVDAPPADEGRTVGRDGVYKVYFHGPAYQVLEKVQVTGNRSVGLMAENLPANTNPDGVASLMAPRLIELCFQTAGMWEILTRGMMALPAAIESVTTYRQPEEANGQRLTAYVTVRDGGRAFDAQVVDESGNLYVDMRGYRTAELGPVTL